MTGDPDTERLRVEQIKRELEERKYAETAPAEPETAQHKRRADKARYLQEKLAQRADSEREAADADDEAPAS
ncbi:MAG: hypothetical protein JO244_03875 [Solirubrobacterales bacterium]|nr:hypothetical protein [Solirubrobacterales bacterium]